MTADAGPARLLRPSDGWAPVGPPLPPYADPEMHDLARDTLAHDYRILPVSTDARPGDVLICRERAWRLTGRVSEHHHAWVRLVAYARANYYDADAWLDRVGVWSTHQINPRRTP